VVGAVDLKNKFYFAVWGAEELGSILSKPWLKSSAEISPIYLNFDMLGSLNLFRFINQTRMNPLGSTAIAPA
jgi:hypothetical protein